MSGGEESPQMVAGVEAIARVCHEANRGWQAAVPSSAVPVSLGWDEVDEELRESARIGVAGVLDGNTPEESHELWSATKDAQGWIYGPVKDEALKQHPCLVEYDELPVEQRAKDALFAAVVRALAPAFGLEVRVPAGGEPRGSSGQTFETAGSNGQHPRFDALEALVQATSLLDLHPEQAVRAASLLLQEARWDDEERSDAQWRAELLVEAVETAAKTAEGTTRRVMEEIMRAGSLPYSGRPPLD